MAAITWIELFWTLFWPTYQDLPWPISYIPRVCRLLSFITIAPILFLIALDMAAYIYFRVTEQQVFGERTAFWTFPRPTWRSRGPTPASSPDISRSTALPEAPKLEQRTPKKTFPSDIAKGRPVTLTEADVPDRTGSPRRTQSWVKMRTGSVGFEGPLLGFENIRSPSPEERPLPDLEETDSEQEWIKASAGSSE